MARALRWVRKGLYQMKDLSLHVLDIAQNSYSAGATRVDISLIDEGTLRTLVIADDGRGMSPEFLASVTDPFTTTRTTRKVGMGLPLLRLAAEQTGGGLEISSTLGVGTTVRMTLHTDHIDCPPIGDMAGTIPLLIQGAPKVRLTYRRAVDAQNFTFDTAEISAMLGEDISLGETEIVYWMQGYLKELEQDLDSRQT